MNSKQLAVIAAKQEIQTREQFHKALAHVNESAKQADISVEAAKATFTKAEALRAWASFDKRLTVEEKKEANRAMTRTVRMLAELAEREQFNAGRGGLPGRGPGAVAWLERELGIRHSRAADVRRLVTKPEIYRVALDRGLHWATAVAGASRGNARGGGGGILSRALQFVQATNTLERALKITAAHFTRELSRIRKIRAWCEAYEHALVQRQAQASKDKGRK